MKMGKLIALMTVTSAAMYTVATVVPKIVVSKLDEKKNKKMIDITKVSKNQRSDDVSSHDFAVSHNCADDTFVETSETEIKNHDKISSVNHESLSRDVMFAMIDTYEKHVPYSSGHSKRVAEISRAIGEKMGFEDLDGLYYAALLHDAGKVYINQSLFSKAKLNMTEHEKQQWYSHPKFGADFVRTIPEISRYAEFVEHHHERYDGSGYPSGLKGEEIPLGSRIIAVADAYEAMSSERPNREPYPREYIISELNKCSGNQFDPKVARCMRAVIADIETQKI